LADPTCDSSSAGAVAEAQTKCGPEPWLSGGAERTALNARSGLSRQRFGRRRPFRSSRPFATGQNGGSGARLTLPAAVGLAEPSEHTNSSNPEPRTPEPMSTGPTMMALWKTKPSRTPRPAQARRERARETSRIAIVRQGREDDGEAHNAQKKRGVREHPVPDWDPKHLYSAISGPVDALRRPGEEGGRDVPGSGDHPCHRADDRHD
jgi:hypothetical protein